MGSALAALPDQSHDPLALGEVLEPVGQAVCAEGHAGIEDEAAALECSKGIPRVGYPFAGAADRTRTGTELPPADFKSAVSAIPPQRRIPYYFSIVFGSRQGGRDSVGVGVPDDPVMRSIT